MNLLRLIHIPLNAAVYTVAGVSILNLIPKRNVYLKPQEVALAIFIGASVRCATSMFFEKRQVHPICKALYPTLISGFATLLLASTQYFRFKSTVYGTSIVMTFSLIQYFLFKSKGQEDQ
jgi:hypothetical protein